MKRVRIMLTAITFLAALGGTLSLKARTYGGFAYCTSINHDATRCPLKVLDKEVLPGAAVAYTTVTRFIVCTTNTPCNHLGEV